MQMDSLPPMLVLCGGLGTRLRAVVSDRPKPMAEVSSRPLLLHLLEFYQSQGVSRFVMCAGFQGEIIREYFQFRADVTVLVESEPLGTGGALAQAMRSLEAPHYLAANGDSFAGVDVRALYELTASRRLLASLAAARDEKRTDGGGLEIRDDGILLCFQEKLPSPRGWINAGVYCLSRELLSQFPSGKFSLELEMLPRLVPTKRMGVLKCETELLDIGTPDRYETAAAKIDQIKGTFHETRARAGAVSPGLPHPMR